MFYSLSIIPGLLIWASYIEPNIVQTHRLTWFLDEKSLHLENLKIIFISDLHIKKNIPNFFLRKIIKKINIYAPDILLFGGDFICRASLEDPSRLKEFFSSFSPKYGSYGVLGNHDYSEYVSQTNNYEIKIIKNTKGHVIKRILSSLKNSFSGSCPKITFHSSLKTISQHSQLMNLLKNTPIKILHNETISLPIGLNIVGLGEYMLQKTDPKTAFLSYDSNLPGIVLLHNPNAISQIISYPGDWILSGHTHGQQIKIPGLNYFKNFASCLTGIQDPKLLRGLTSICEPNSQKINKYIYVNRGLSSGGSRIRFNSIPEITYIQCKRHV